MDIHQRLITLRRPRLLMEAVRYGLNSGAKLRLPRGLNPQGDLLLQLFNLEEQQEARRLSGDGAYQPRHHIEILTALIGGCKTALAAQGPQFRRAG